MRKGVRHGDNMVDVACMAMSSWGHELKLMAPCSSMGTCKWVTATVEYSMWYESDYHITIFVLRMHHLYVQIARVWLSSIRASVGQPHAAVRTIKLV
jgi:hypothetical protein